MYGTKQDFLEDVWNRLKDVDINILEKGLLNKHLEDPVANCGKIVDTLRKIQTRN